MLGEKTLGVDEQLSLLNAAADGDPFVGEPDLMIAQIYFRFGEYAKALAHARRGVSRMYMLTTAWDKRRSFAAWVGFGRILAMRSRRKSYGLHSLPQEDGTMLTSDGQPLVSVQKVLQEM